MDDLISIIVPVYNVEKYLKKCIESLLNQSYKNIEVILINDGSTDNCKSICDHYQNIDRRINVIDSENKGVSSARNIGLSICKGKYILFVDSDDWVETDMIEELYCNIVKTKSQISICNYYEVDENKKYSKSLKIESVFDAEKLICYAFDESFFRGYLWNKLFSRDIIFYEDDNYVKFNEKIHISEDLHFVFKVALNTDKICYIDKKLYNYVQRNNSALSSEFTVKDISKLLIFEDLIAVASQYNTELSKKITFEYVRCSMDMKYDMYKYGYLSSEISKELNKIRNKKILYGLKSKEHKLSQKIKLIINSTSCYLYGTLRDIKVK